MAFRLGSFRILSFLLSRLFQFHSGATPERCAGSCGSRMYRATGIPLGPGPGLAASESFTSTSESASSQARFRARRTLSFLSVSLHFLRQYFNYVLKADLCYLD